MCESECACECECDWAGISSFVRDCYDVESDVSSESASSSDTSARRTRDRQGGSAGEREEVEKRVGAILALSIFNDSQLSSV